MINAIYNLEDGGVNVSYKGNVAYQLAEFCTIAYTFADAEVLTAFPFPLEANELIKMLVEHAFENEGRFDPLLFLKELEEKCNHD